MKIWESRKQELQGTETDGSLSFDLYVSSLCKKKKLSVLAQVFKFMSLN